jgi:hypothetical protein
MHREFNPQMQYCFRMFLEWPIVWCHLLSCMGMHQKGPITPIEVVTFLVDFLLNVDFYAGIEAKSGILKWYCT